MPLNNIPGDPSTLSEDDLVLVENQTGAYKGRAHKLHKLLTTQHASSTRWLDLLGPAGAAIAGGMDRAANGDLLASSIITENAYFRFQINHNVLIGGSIEPHIHWRKSTDAAGDVVWQMKWRMLVIGAVATAWSAAWLDVTSRYGTLSADQRHIVDEFAHITPTGAGLSTLIEVEIQRDHDHVDDDYGADAVLMDCDLHVRIDSLGSVQEYTK